jgi:hypothetical protein
VYYIIQVNDWCRLYQQNTMKCKACGSTIEVISAQTRSADEGATFIRTCPSCPLDVSAFLSSRIEPHIYIPRSRPGTYILPHVETDAYTDVFKLCVRSSNPRDIAMERAMCYNAVGEQGSVFKCYVSGPYQGLCLREVSRETVAPLVSLVRYRMARFSPNHKDVYLGMTYAIFSNHTEFIIGQDRYAFYDLEDTSVDAICDGIDTLYLAGHAPKYLAEFVSRVTLGAMSNLTARGYDRSGDLPEGCKMSVKPDGERLWLMRSGVVWTMSRRLLGHEIILWITDRCIDRASPYSLGPCVDIEFMYMHSPILIDILLDESGTLSQQQRTLDWIQMKLIELQKLFSYLDIIQVREWFDNIHDAELYRLTCRYPTDGVVAIQRDNTDMFKIKSIKSVELRVDGNTLVSDEGIPLIELDGHHGYTNNSIVEVRLNSKDSKLHLLEHFLRTDKVSANKMNAIEMILQSLSSADSPNILRNQLWRWSNMLRTVLYNRASRMSVEKRIIMDVGTGEGQSVESFIKGKSYILVEPDYNKCVLLARRINVRVQDIKKDARSLIPVMTRLIHGSMKYIILNCKLEDILDDVVVCSNITNLVGCCVSSFSAQFVVDLVPLLRERCGIPFIGSCYMYDNLEIGESIIDSSGISMTRTSDKEAMVRWGKDKIYTEPALTLEDISTDILVQSSVNEVPYNPVRTDDPGIVATEHVKILICS